MLRINTIPTRKFTSISPVALITDVLNFVHDPISMPWGTTIIASTILFRTICTFPLALNQQKRIQRFQSIQPLIKAWNATAIRLSERQKIDHKQFVSFLIV